MEIKGVEIRRLSHILLALATTLGLVQGVVLEGVAHDAEVNVAVEVFIFRRIGCWFDGLVFRLGILVNLYAHNANDKSCKDPYLV